MKKRFLLLLSVIVMSLACIPFMASSVSAANAGTVLQNPVYSDLNDDDISRLQSQGYNLDSYQVMEFNWTLYGFMDSTSDSAITQRTQSDNIGRQFITNGVWLTKECLPNGTLIWVNSGYGYRPDGFNANWDNNSQSTRPGNVTTTWTMVDNSWWGNWTYRAFNFSVNNGSIVATEETKNEVANSNFRVYVPKSENSREMTDEEREALKTYLGSSYNEGDYVVLDWKPVHKYFWNSTESTNLQNNYNGNNATFLSSSIRFTKSDIPEGSVLWIKPGYQYRPDGWKNSGLNNQSTRPANTSTEYTLVDANWWSNWEYRGFNVSKAGTVLNGTETDVFKIFVPKANEEPPTPEEPKSIKVLAIGNSFSVDAMEYLWNVMNSAGYTDITLGNLYIGGCSLNTHWSNISQNAVAYKYYKNTSGTWTSTSSSVLSALEEEEWDIVTVQQVSQDSGMPGTYTNLDNILNYVKEKEPNAEIYWHMTWAYQSDSTHSGFANYNKNQAIMYNAILSTVKENVMNKVSGVIPSGIAIQKLRATTVGDTLTRDGYHLNYGNGRYTAALTWLAYIEEHHFKNENWQDTLNSVTWTPTGYAVNFDLAKQSVIASLQADAYDPLEVEQEPEEPTSQSFRELTDEEREQLKAYFGTSDIGDYVVLDWQPEIGCFWNSDSSKVLQYNYNPKNAFISSTVRFIKDDIPNGSVIWLENGYSYRPEGWVGEGDKNGVGRPANVLKEYTLVDDSWWGSFTYRAFNLSKDANKDGKPDGVLDYESEKDKLKIFVPAGHNTDTDKGAEITNIEYKNGFDMPGTVTYRCTRCGALITEETPSAPAIFKVLGYSVPETEGVKGIKAGYEVNFDALSKYESVTGDEIEYGLVTANAKYAGEIAGAIDNGGNEKVFSVSLKDKDFNRFNVTVQGFKGTEEHNNLRLVMLAYVKSGDKVQYLQSETNDGEAEGFKVISFSVLTAVQSQAEITYENKEDL